MQFGRIARGEEYAARVLGNTGETGVCLVLQVKAHDMSGEFHPLFRKLCRQRTGIGVAGLYPVRDQHQRCRVVAVGEQIGGMFDGSGDRRFADRFDGIHLRLKRLFVHRLRGHQGFDIGAIALAAMTIGDEPQVRLSAPPLDQIPQHIAGNFHLGDAVNLSPHGPGRIIDDDDIFCRLRPSGAKDRGDSEFRSNHFHLRFSFNYVPCRNRRR